MTKICTVIKGNTIEEFLENLRIIQEKSNFVELRVDYISNLSIADLDIIREHTHKKSIFTCRSKSEGGQFPDNIDLFPIIYKANELKFDYIDIERSKLPKVEFNKKNCKIIASYHNFQETPSFNELERIYSSMLVYDFVDVVKIATNVQKDEDNINLVKLVLKKTKDIIAIGMGEKGKILRIVSPLIGGYLTFASVGENITAPGQIEISELKKILKYDR